MRQLLRSGGKEQRRTGHDVHHVPMIQRRRDVRLLLLLHPRLEEADGRAVDVSGYDADARVRRESVLLQFHDQPIPLSLSRVTWYEHH